MFRETRIAIAERMWNGLFFYDISYARFLLLRSGFTKN